MDLLSDLAARGLIHDTTDKRALTSRLAAGPVGIYIGFDPSADSLHAGHLVGQLFLRRFQLAGHRPFPLAGGATGMIGDPSGRREERAMLDVDSLRHNVECIGRQLRRLLDFEPGPTQATLVSNADWTEPISLLAFLRDVGKYVPVNQMLAKDSVRSRLDSESGISYTEFSYSLLQANDFRHLFERHGVEVQGGGSDQWGNIVAGVDLIRRRLGTQAHAVTHPLITNASGDKMGKTASGAVWLDAARTSPYQFHQFWVQTEDQLVSTYTKVLSLRPLAEIEAGLAAHEAAPERRAAQRALADELTSLVHGAEAARAATDAAAVLFGGDPLAASAAALETLVAEVPSSRLGAEQLRDIVAVLLDTGLAASNSEARRLLQQGAVRVNGAVITAADDLTAIGPLHGRYLVLRKGKRTHHVVEISRRGG